MRTPRRLALAALLAFFLPLSAAGQAGEAVQFLKAQGQPPVEYVLSKLRERRAVLLGETHWVRHDVQLVIDLIPRLRSAGADAVGMEMLPASSQPAIDRIVAAGTWDAAAAMGVLRAGAWPYREYLEIVHAVWKHNREQPPDAKKLKLIALGPGTDWRERLLPRGETYDQFMARLVLDFLKEPGRRILVYAGIHHAFTRYHQPELPRDQRVERFMDRMGNILWREIGEEVFFVLLGAPWQCRTEVGNGWTRCLPVRGAVDCAAAALNHPAGFDIAGSPFADLRITPDFLYGLGYPSLRLVDFADGYIWTRPIEEYQGVGVIPLSEFAPDEPSLEEVARNNPFSDAKGLKRTDLQTLWDGESERLRDIQKSFGLQRLSTWREACDSSPPPND